MKIKLRIITKEDLADYHYWKLPIHKYHDYNGPYFKKAETEEIEKEIKRIAEVLQKGNSNPSPKRMLITNAENELIGEVNWY